MATLASKRSQPHCFAPHIFRLVPGTQCARDDGHYGRSDQVLGCHNLYSHSSFLFCKRPESPHSSVDFSDEERLRTLITNDAAELSSSLADSGAGRTCRACEWHVVANFLYFRFAGVSYARSHASALFSAQALLSYRLHGLPHVSTPGCLGLTHSCADNQLLLQVNFVNAIAKPEAAGSLGRKLKQLGDIILSGGVDRTLVVGDKPSLAAMRAPLEGFLTRAADVQARPKQMVWWSWCSSTS